MGWAQFKWNLKFKIKIQKIRNISDINISRAHPHTPPSNLKKVILSHNQPHSPSKFKKSNSGTINHTSPSIFALRKYTTLLLKSMEHSHISPWRFKDFKNVTITLLGYFFHTMPQNDQTSTPNRPPLNKFLTSLLTGPVVAWHMSSQPAELCR